MAERFEIAEKAMLSFLDGKKYGTLRDMLSTMNPSDIAGIFDSLEEQRIPVMFRLLPKELAAEVFVEMEPDAQELLIKGFSDNELKEVLDELYVDDAADLVDEMPANVVKRILSHTDPETRKSINEILKYPEDSAGSIMTTEFVDLKAFCHVFFLLCSPDQHIGPRIGLLGNRLKRTRHCEEGRSPDVAIPSILLTGSWVRLSIHGIATGLRPSQ